MRTLTQALALALTLALTISARAELKLPAVIGDHMVLQQKQNLRIWGWADPGDKITVTLAGKKAKATTDKDGRWVAKLGKFKAGGPHELVVSTGDGESRTIQDVLIGEVWVCSGQSNMEWSVKHGIENGENHAAEANHPQIRLFDIANTTADEPRDDVQGQWTPCTPEAMTTFSAVGYFFGRKLHQELGVPIGLIGSNWGGTIAEAWTSPEALEREKRLAETVEQLASAGARAANPQANPNRPSVLYNAMIAPITNYAIRGAIWYQGESNVPRAAEYQIAFPTLIKSWRDAWGDRNLPFLYVQIAPFKYSSAFNNAFGVNEYGLPLLWDAQLHTLERVDNVGMVVVHDVGNVDDIHPRNKLVVGERLANWALEDTYDRDFPVSGPIYDDWEVRGDKIEIEFFHEGAGLATRDGKPPTHFEIAGEDRVFHPATAKINSDDTVLVHSDAVKKPRAVRFAWHETAEPNLINREGLPASPFRTDDWPVDTTPR